MKISLRIYIRNLFFITFLSQTLVALSQPYNNNWINYNQSYYKFKISENGLYSIDSLTLFNSGIPIGSIDPRNFQIFAKGVEIPLYIEGEGDGIFDNSDKIIFYALKNDGWFDEGLYGAQNLHPNPYYSLFNDTINYFLTWNNSTSNLRYTIENDTNFTSYTPSNYFEKEVLNCFSNKYFTGKTLLLGSSSENLFGYDKAEGWFDYEYYLDGFSSYTISTPNIYSSSGGATLKTTVLGESDYSQVYYDQHLQLKIGNTTIDTIFEGYDKIDLNIQIPIADLTSPFTGLTYSSINDLGSTVGRQAVSYIKINYPHTTDLEGKSSFNKIFINDDLLQTKSYFQFSNLIGSGKVFFIDVTNNKLIETNVNGSNFECLIPNSGGLKECVAIRESELDTIYGLFPVTPTTKFTDYSQTVDTAFIIITHSSLLNEANAYSNYRLSSFTNPQNSFVVDIQELYDQFAYGIDKHPYSIRGFVDFVYDNWSTHPNYLFLIGKSIKANLSRSGVDFHNNLVPSFGHPASDIMLISGLNGSITEPLIPMGRIAALTPDHVNYYLNKIIEYENPVPNQSSSPYGETDWMKQALHFAGGDDANSASLFMSYLDSYKAIFEGSNFGGNVNSFAKTTSAPIQTTMSDSIRQAIGNGVSLMTFFGHASATGGFDQNIDDPDDWPNQNGKYPFLLGNACLAGDIHLPSANSISEKYVLNDNKGVIGFLASVDFGVASSLNTYSAEFYRNLSYKNYGGSVGQHIKNTIQETQGAGQNIITNSSSLGMTLHGDPSISIHSYEKPDYMIQSSSVYFTPENVTSDIDSFDVNIVVANLGKSIDTNITIELTRVFPTNMMGYTDTTYFQLITAPKYKDTVTFKLPVDLIRGLGINMLNIFVDALGEIDEIHESNNQINVPLEILSGEIIPIFPYKYAIIPNQGITLKASTAFPFEPAKNYIFEVDTTDYFNSPIKESTMIYSAGGIITWQPNMLLNMPDSTVYYWRVGKDSVDASGYKWRNSSFQYINGKEGWEQAHFLQFDYDEYEFIKHNRATRRFEFTPNVKQLKCINYGAATADEVWDIKYLIDLDRMGYNGWSTMSAFHVAILDSKTFKPWNAEEMDMGQANTFGTGSYKKNFFIFRHSDSQQMNAMTNMLNDSVPNDNIVLIWTWYYETFSWYSPIPANLRNAFQNLGGTNVANVQDSIPFIFFAKKGDTSSAIEVIGDSVTHKELILTTTLTSTANYANIFSEILGPVKSWDSLSWEMTPLEDPTQDSSILNVYGINNQGVETLLVPNLPTDSANIRLTDIIDATVYPYMKLNTFLKDTLDFTAPQLKRWQITYEEIPECALEPSFFYYFYNDTVQEGENIKLSIAIKNISLRDMDSLLISFKVMDRNGQFHTIPYARQKPLLADSIIIATIEFSSYGYPGLNYLMIDVNPDNDQLEKYHFNNVAQIPFYVGQDRINPILDVTFDGIHILSGDIVSPQPEIVIELTDENKYLALDDTSDFQIYIKNPAGVEKRKYFSSNGVNDIRFYPASLPKNKAKMIFKDMFPVDGIYQLRVQATDKSKNQSGLNDYKIDFEVINKSTITNLLNYPNPFTTATKFVFTLTGSKIPDIFKIQILTVSGKVVKEIHKDELGSIRIGRNITDYTWDGTDTYGDRLANGLYFYRVVTKIGDNDIELRETKADSYFKNGFGKMYLFR
ncbi:MAG: hypothetical protein IT232_07000 [Flavobacteriales bacterium]|nr:hypothetical protein [Flavobacteriales bacterium]